MAGTREQEINSFLQSFGRSLANSGYTTQELRAIERAGGSVTEGFLKMYEVFLDGGLEKAEVFGQSPDHLQRLLSLEEQGKNPNSEGTLDIALKQQPTEAHSIKPKLK